MEFALAAFVFAPALALGGIRHGHLDRLADADLLASRVGDASADLVGVIPRIAIHGAGRPDVPVIIPVGIVSAGGDRSIE